MNLIQFKKHVAKSSLMLILVMLSNMTQAFSPADMTHTFAHESSSVHGVTAVSEPATHLHDHSSMMSKPEMNISLSWEPTGPTDISEDCVCDEVCCLGSVSFGASSTNAYLNSVDKVARLTNQHYQSISLDLLLPPPNQ